MADGDLLAELLEREHRGWESLCNNTGANFYGSIMTETAVMILAHGFVLDRDGVVASLNEAPPWHSYAINDERLVETGADHAILVYTGRAYKEGNDPAFVALMSTVYVRDEGQWRIALYQQTPIPGETD